MKIKIQDLLHMPGASRTFKEDFSIQEITLQDRTIIFPEAIQVEVTVTNTQDQILVQGRMEGKAVLPCARCLEHFHWPFALTFTEGYDKKGSEAINLNQDLDLTEELYQFLIINIPIKVVCDTNCQGLCPFCGSSKNEEECTCTEKEVDPRWDQLRKLLDQKDQEV